MSGLEGIAIVLGGSITALSIFAIIMSRHIKALDARIDARKDGASPAE